MNHSFSDVPDLAESSLRWTAAKKVLTQVPVNLRPWLLYPDSLTKALVAKSKGNFAVEVSSECWQHYNSANLLQCLDKSVARQRMWSRKVILKGMNRPWVAAHTLVPQCSLASPLKQIRNLQTKPLGAFLFSHPGLKKSRLDIVKLENGIWGRRALYYLYNKPIIVAEFFLPEFLLD